MKLKVFLVVLTLIIGSITIYIFMPTTIKVNANHKYQTIDGWAYLARMWEEDKVNNRFDPSFEKYSTVVSKYLVDVVGINAVRVEIQSGMENPKNQWASFYNGTLPHKEFENYRFEKINDNDDPNITDLSGFQFEQFDWRLETMVLPLKQHLESRGEQLHINVNYTDFKWSKRIQQGTLSHASNPEEYAEFVLVFFQRMRDKYGLIPDSFELILEPDNTAEWTGEKIGYALLAVKKRLATNGFTPEFVATSASSTKKSISYFKDLLRVPNAVEQLDTLSYHRYGESTADIIELKKMAEENQLKTAMLEKVNAGIDQLLEDLTVGSVASWQQWASAAKSKSQAGGRGAYYALVNTDYPPKSAKLSMAKKTKQLSSVFCFVRRGAVRIDSKSSAFHKTTAAFINKNGGWALIVRDKYIGGKVKIEGLPAGKYGLRLVSDNSGSIKHLPPVIVENEELLVTTIPAKGVLTVYNFKSAKCLSE